eukprot:GABU01004505.1.p1 GENE.GABU01004505.1~~GABU01004505.1.p1  ORF type:complete len:110 (+),score=14.15 GABU01004505.1:334-663(+)
MEFCWFIEPKEEERARQKGALEDLLNLVGPLIPKAIIETHGAFGCGLSFAKGPIELAVIDMQSSKAQLLKSFSRALLNFPTHFCNLTISSGSLEVPNVLWSSSKVSPFR